ncbi:uncharacterized protein LOC110413295 [Herrania umbratica]|uniref:Uncharacterized protein LOC110413295 n=1 Tax=Herrania umbratica TaxID=108875 RepID=A0A6J0ZYD1_9ROSI|nr:uncharacterized protein LOC110413295 [Herrania umbratica]
MSEGDNGTLFSVKSATPWFVIGAPLHSSSMLALLQENDAKPHILEYNESKVTQSLRCNDNPEKDSFLENSDRKITSNQLKVEPDKCSLSSSVDERDNLFVGIVCKKLGMLEHNAMVEAELYPENNDQGIADQKMEEFGPKESSSSSSTVKKDNFEIRTMDYTLEAEEVVRNISVKDQRDEHVYASELNASKAENMSLKLNEQREKQSEVEGNCFLDDVDVSERNFSVENVTSPTNHATFDINAVGSGTEGISLSGENGCNGPGSKESDQVPIKDLENNEKSQMVNGGAVWDIFRKQDVLKIYQYLEKHKKEFRHLNNLPVNSVIHPIHDQTLFLNERHKKQLREEFNVEPWTFEQYLGEAVFIPAGCPHQVRNRQSCIKVALDFVSPDNIEECIRLTKDFRMLPKNHRAKEDKLEVKKMVLYAVSSAVKEARSLMPNQEKCGFGMKLLNMRCVLLRR